MKRVIFLSILSLFFITGCHPYGGGVVVGGSYSNGYVAPPSHAPAYGHRQNHRYYYYPNADFYFDVDRSMYFYLDSRGSWTFSVNLPIHLRTHLHNGYGYVEFEMENDRPYSRHKFHKNKYNKRLYREQWKYKADRKYKKIRKYEKRKELRNERRYEKKKELRNERRSEKRKELRDERRYEKKKELRNERRSEKRKERRESRNNRDERSQKNNRKSVDDNKYRNDKNKSKKNRDDDESDNNRSKKN